MCTERKALRAAIRILGDEVVNTALARNVPIRDIIQAAAVIAFQFNIKSKHASVIRDALCELDRKDYLDDEISGVFDIAHEDTWVEGIPEPIYE